jgi:hypothetical protein
VGSLSTAQLDEIGVAKPLSIVENTDDLGGDPKEDYFFQLSRHCGVEDQFRSKGDGGHSYGPISEKELSLN